MQPYLISRLKTTDFSRKLNFQLILKLILLVVMTGFVGVTVGYWSKCRLGVDLFPTEHLSGTFPFNIIYHMAANHFPF